MSSVRGAPLRWAVVGAGSVGSVVGAHLHMAGRDVTLVDVNEDHVAAIRDRGLTMKRPGLEDVVVPMPATTTPHKDLDQVDVAIVLCKGFSTIAAATSMAPFLADDGFAITLQNGLGNDRALATVLGADRVLPGSTTIGAETHAPGVVAAAPATGQGLSLTHIGPPRSAERIPAGLLDLALQLTQAGLPTKAVPSADTVIWRKLAMAASMGVLTAATRRTVHDVMADPTAWALWNEMFDEVLHVADALGLDLEPEQLRVHCDATFTGVGHHVTSMAADVVAGRRTEVDTIAFELVARAEVVGVPIPVIATLGRVIKSLEGSYERAL